MADQRLRSDLYAWLTTIDADLQPHSSLVFFFWDGSGLLIYTPPDRRKVGNIEAHPRVSVNLNAKPDGSGVISIAGKARLRRNAPTSEGYVEKYSDLLTGFGLSPDEFARQYSIEITVSPVRVRAW